jgi:hypothetical protein
MAKRVRIKDLNSAPYQTAMWELVERVFFRYVRTFPVSPLRRFFELP